MDNIDYIKVKRLRQYIKFPITWGILIYLINKGGIIMIDRVNKEIKCLEDGKEMRMNQFNQHKESFITSIQKANTEDILNIHDWISYDKMKSCAIHLEKINAKLRTVKYIKTGDLS